MSDFCTASYDRSYLWWRADAWTGKSALMSSFVLNPPPAIRVVSFFITARFAGQADRVAFSDIVLEQLLDLLGEPRPTFLTEATRDAHLLGAMTRAAALCRGSGQRLVLVVDGLDEDQGTVSSAGTHSIASLLPADPPDGMRIIVAGRLNPPVPSDVPDRHPLRDPAIVRILARSTFAEVVRHDAERELKKILRGPTTDRDLLGLITAAGGGLSGEDLSHLTGMAAWEVDDHLGAVTGRMYVPRPGNWQPAMKIYVLGHEELQQQANRYLGSDLIADYRAKLHRWADSYKAARWPPNTLDYLFRGYFRLLQATRDHERMLAYATDRERHNRMLDLAGGDTSALAEIGVTQEAFLEEVTVDLMSMSRLAVHRTALERRNEAIPSNLPVVWAQLGRVNRAEALARSITDSPQQIRAIASVVRQLASIHDRRVPQVLNAQAERSLAAIDEPYALGLALAVVARSYAYADDPARATTLLRRGALVAESFEGSPQQAKILSALARAWAALGEISTARGVAENISARSERSEALVGVATEASRLGYFETARQISESIRNAAFAAQAYAIAARDMAATTSRPEVTELARKARVQTRRIRDDQMKAWDLALIADALAAADLPEEASLTLGAAEKAARSITRASDRENAFVKLSHSLAAAGNLDRATMVANEIAKPLRRVRAIAAIASALATSGATESAEEFAINAESAARSSVAPGNESRALATLAQAAAAARALPQAEQVAMLISDGGQRDRALTVIVQALAVGNDIDRAVEVAASIKNAGQCAKALHLVVKAVVQRKEFARALEIARLIQIDVERKKAQADIAKARKNNIQSAKGEASFADSKSVGETPLSSDETYETPTEIINRYTEVYPRAKALTKLAIRIAAKGDPDRALEAARFIENLPLRANAYVEVAGAIRPIDPRRPSEVLEQAIETANATLDPQLRDRVLGAVAAGLVANGSFDRMEQVGLGIKSPTLQARAFTFAAKAAVAHNLNVRATAIAELIPQPRLRDKALLAVVQSGSERGQMLWAEDTAQSISSPALRGSALAAVAQALARSGDLPGGERIARSLAGYSGQADLFVKLAAGAEPEDSRRLVAQALTIGDWNLCLSVLLRIAPHAVEVIAEEVTLSHR